MKNIFLKYSILVICLFFILNLSAQLTEKSIAEDFTINDINGNSHELYAYLDSGYTVILDFFAIWCPPCWSIHQTHVLQDVWEAHGPNGDNTIRILSIESDGSTAESGLFGNGTTTLGDWTYGIDYPIANNSSLSSAYNINYFPTFYMVCPERLVYQFSNGDLLEDDAIQTILDKVNTCGEANLAYDIAPFEYLAEKYTCSEITPKFSFHNLGTEIIQNANFTLLFDGMPAENALYSGFLNQFESDEIEFSSHVISKETSIEVEVTLINGNNIDEGAHNDISTAAIVNGPEPILTDTVFLEILTDHAGYAFSSEIYWEFRDDLGNIIKNGGNLDLTINSAGQFNSPGVGGYADSSLVVEAIQLPQDGCFRLFMIDSYGNGIIGGGFQVKNSAGSIIYQNNTFTDKIIVPFEYEYGIPTSVLDSYVNDFDLTIFPNPAKDAINLSTDYTSTEKVQLHLINLKGETIVSKSDYIENLNRLDLSKLFPGLYFLKLSTEGGKLLASKRIAVQK